MTQRDLHHCGHYISLMVSMVDDPKKVRHINEIRALYLDTTFQQPSWTLVFMFLVFLQNVKSHSNLLSLFTDHLMAKTFMKSSFSALFQKVHEIQKYQFGSSNLPVALCSFECISKEQLQCFLWNSCFSAQQIFLQSEIPSSANSLSLLPI